MRGDAGRCRETQGDAGRFIPPHARLLLLLLEPLLGARLAWYAAGLGVGVARLAWCTLGLGVGVGVGKGVGPGLAERVSPCCLMEKNMGASSASHSGSTWLGLGLG